MSIQSGLIKIKSFLNNYVYVRIRVFIFGNYESELNKLGKDINKIIFPHNEKPLKILIGPSFSIYPPVFTHDRLLSYSLKLNGANIIPIYCDGVQKVECNVYGGVWSKPDFETNCKHCIKCSEHLWADSQSPAILLSNFLNESDKEKVKDIVSGLKGDEWVCFTKSGMPFGYWAKDILVNNYVVGDHHLIPNHFNLGIAHLQNLLLLEIAYENILLKIKPDRVISNDSYYGMWAILETLCKKNNIPFYSHWGPVNNGAWAYAFNDGAMNLDFSKPWQKFSKVQMNSAQVTKVQNWLDQRFLGKELLIDTASSGGFKTEEFDINSIDFTKPTAMLAANVIWDLAALNKQIVFDDMIDWIAKTIIWFSDHPAYQLIIKPHPAEVHPSIPETKERVEVALNLLGIPLPYNVILLSPKVNLTVYEILPKLTVLLVHTTTVGLEAVALGLPVITTAKSPYRGFGFTDDPKSPDEYYTALSKALSEHSIIVSAEKKELAFKFILFYHFHYYTKINILDYKWGSNVKTNIYSIKDLQKGENLQRDYIIDSILKGLPILSEDRWMPENP